MSDGVGMAASLPLENYFGPAVVLDVSPLDERIKIQHVAAKLAKFADKPRRILFKTSWLIRHEVFEEKYAYFSVDLIEEMARREVIMMGIDTPSVDYIHSKTLDAHHALLQADMCWLENLDLTQVEEGEYFLVALPLKFTEIEASPVRAVLLQSL
jgi:arylformamidase